MLCSVVALLLSAVAAPVVLAQQQYEYIVVGSGPGGGPLAANLARAGHSVLLLEAGEDHGTNANQTQLFNFNAATSDPKTRWDFWVRHFDNDADDLKYKYLTWRRSDGSFYVGLSPPAGAQRLGVWYPRAGTLGGCATHNAGIVSLPADWDWNNIMQITGDSNWSAANMRRMYQRLERCLYMPSGTAGHGFNGYLSVSQEDLSWVNQASDARTLAELAAGATGGSASQLMTLMRRDMNALDPNRDTTIGIFGGTRHADNAGARSSPNTYIRATLNDAARYPLTIQVNSLVTKVLFSNDSTPTAIGVEYLRGTSLYGADPRSSASNQGTTAQAFASREVIIAGGVFNSPQILKLSGIGPRAELERFNIPVVVDLPGVGNNMGDNYEDGIIGRFSRSPGFGGTTTNFLKTANSPNGLRNIYMFCGGFAFEGYWPGFPNNYGTGTYGCSLVHMYPRSQRGTVTLRSANPRDLPEINFRFYQENSAQDLQDLYEAVTWVRQNMLTRLSGNTFTEIHPCENSGCSEASQKEYLRLQTYSHHATSSCKIGADNDPQAVLDGQFRVRGVRRLRVVDGSAFPAVPGAFPVISTFMLAEKATDDILRDVNANPSSSSSISSVSSTTSASSTTVTTPTTTSRISTTTTSSTSTSRPPTTTASNCAARWGQCGGQNWTGPNCCQSPYTCRAQNQWYSQCL